ncbi:MAG TPA: hypothetical protein VFI25_02375 [Planctomycetota bacterium]|nr:hypothetical protein [Planctomycetota bacterium]
MILSSVALLAGAILGLLTVENGRARRTRTEVERTRAFTMAESGIDHVRVLLDANALPPSGILDWSSDGQDNDGDGRVDEGDESLRATTERWWSDAVDNDGDGLVDESDEGLAHVASTVRIGTSTVTVTGWVQRLATEISFSTPAVVNLVDPNAKLIFKGNSFLIDGRDRDLSGGWTNNPPVYGIATAGSKLSVLAQLSKQQLDNVNGAGGKPSITTWSAPSSSWLPSMVETMRTQADVTFDHYGSTYTGSLGSEKTGNYLVTYSQGDLKIGGGSTGAGVLCVDGNLEITGKWEFVGVILVTGGVTVKGGGSSQRLTGSALIGSDFVQELSLQSQIKGGIELVYSSAAVAGISGTSARYTVAAVTEP